MLPERTVVPATVTRGGGQEGWHDRFCGAVFGDYSCGSHHVGSGGSEFEEEESGFPEGEAGASILV